MTAIILPVFFRKIKKYETGKLYAFLFCTLFYEVMFCLRFIPHLPVDTAVVSVGYRIALSAVLILSFFLCCRWSWEAIRKRLRICYAVALAVTLGNRIAYMAAYLGYANRLLHGMTSFDRILEYRNMLYMVVSGICSCLCHRDSLPCQPPEKRTSY